MNFPPPEVLKDIRLFDNLPPTKEKNEIKRQYFDDEIGNFEFYHKARMYLAKVNGE